MLKFDMLSNAGTQTYPKLLVTKNSLVFIGPPCRILAERRCSIYAGSLMPVSQEFQMAKSAGMRTKGAVVKQSTHKKHLGGSNRCIVRRRNEPVRQVETALPQLRVPTPASATLSSCPPT